MRTFKLLTSSRLKLCFVFTFGLLPSFYVAFTEAATAAPVVSDYPVFVAEVANPNDYSLFANGGWDGNWYVGYNTCWIKRLPPIPRGDYVRAFVGAKVGRMKLETNPKNVWDKSAKPGALYMGISSTAAWSKDQVVTLTTTEDIPLEGDFESAVEGTGESQWFWKEVPLTNLNIGGDNYLALGASTPEFLSISSSPVLAAAWGGKDQSTWLMRDVTGAPPRTAPADLGAAISYFQPAMALKLIPRGARHSIRVTLVDWKPAKSETSKPVVTARVEGDSIQRVWLEYARLRSGELNWEKIGRPLWKAPYSISVDQKKLPPGRVQLRVVANNIWEEYNSSLPFTVEVSTSAR